MVFYLACTQSGVNRPRRAWGVVEALEYFAKVIDERGLVWRFCKSGRFIGRGRGWVSLGPWLPVSVWSTMKAKQRSAEAGLG